MPAVSASRWRSDITWSDVPHLTEQAKSEMLASYPPHMRDARSEGIPQLGVGAIYPVSLDSVTCDPFRIPDFWPRGYALDVGWNVTACVWGARDPDADVIYIYSEYYGQQEKPAVHAAAIKARGEWIAGCIDPAARGRSQTDGTRLIDDYQLAGLNVRPALNAVEAGIFEVLSRLSTGRMKFFSTLVHLPREYRAYHRDEKGKVVKKNDHAVDCMRYLATNWQDVFSVQPSMHDTFAAHRPADRLTGY